MTGACHDYRIQPSCSAAEVLHQNNPGQIAGPVQPGTGPHGERARVSRHSKEGERIRAATKAVEPQRIALAKEIRERASALCNETLLPFSADRFQMSVHGAAEVLRKTMQFASALSQALEDQA